MLDYLRSRGSAFIAQVSDELMANPQFVRALQTAYRGKERLDGAVARAMKTMNVPTRTEFKRAVARIEALERELAERRRAEEAPAAHKGARKPRASRRKKPAAGGA